MGIQHERMRVNKHPANTLEPDANKKFCASLMHIMGLIMTQWAWLFGC